MESEEQKPEFFGQVMSDTDRIQSQMFGKCVNLFYQVFKSQRDSTVLILTSYFFSKWEFHDIKQDINTKKTQTKTIMIRLFSKTKAISFKSDIKKNSVIKSKVYVHRSLTLMCVPTEAKKL